MVNLMPHQTEAIETTEGLDRVAYYYDMGLGKTYIGSEKLKLYDNDVNLIICQKSKIKDWVNHFKENYNYHVYDLSNKKQFDHFFASDEKRVGIINYDIVWRRKDILKLSDYTLMLDESSCIKNEKAKRTKFILKLNAKNIILLSGTPTGGKYEELYSQITLLGWNISRRRFWDNYIKFKLVDFTGTGIKQPLVYGYKNVENLINNLYNYGCRFKKTDEVLTLPEQRFITIDCKKTKPYDKFMKDSIIDIEEKTLAGDTTLTKLLYARQLCSQYNEDKIQRFKDILESTDNRVIVFYNFTEEYNRLKKVCKNRPQSVVNGQYKDLSNYENESNSITFIQYQSGAMGLNLQKSNTIIYFSLPLSSELFEQSKKRIHRIGQEKRCIYYVMMSKDTVENDIYERLKLRKDYTDRLFGGGE